MTPHARSLRSSTASAVMACVMLATSPAMSRTRALPSTAPSTTSAAPEASSDAMAPWLAAPRPPDISQARFESAVVAMRKAPPTLLFIGDSITENWLSIGRAIWDSDFAPRGAANLGFGGDRTENTLWRIERGELDGLAPKVTVIEIGTNDLDRWSVSEVALGITAVVRAVRVKLPATHIVVLAILPRDNTATGRDRRRARAVNAILENAAFGPFARYADIGSVLLAANGTLLPSVMEDETLHPSLDGYARLAPAIDRAMSSI